MNRAERIRAFIAANFFLSDDDRLDDDDSLLQAGIVDSMGIVDIVAFLESEFDIHIARNEVTAANLDSVGRIASFVERKIASRDKAGHLA